MPEENEKTEMEGWYVPSTSVAELDQYCRMERFGHRWLNGIIVCLTASDSGRSWFERFDLRH